MSNAPMKRNIGRQIRAEAFSIPNILSYFRLLLIPLFIVLYVQEDFTEALITLAASGLSDILDGRIARKYDMVTDLGKVLDPVADKLTQWRHDALRRDAVSGDVVASGAARRQGGSHAYHGLVCP